MRLGVLDIGSNTGHLLVVDAHGGAAPLPAFSFKEPLRLAEHLDSEGAVTGKGVQALTDFVATALEVAEDKGCEEMLGFATSAVRDASNSEKVLEKVRKETGVELSVLPGEDEARLTFLAVRRWFGWSSGRLMVFDIGGGSLEVAAGKDEAPDVATSLPLGAGRLTREWLPTDPPDKDDVRRLRKKIRADIARIAGSVLRAGSPDHAVATSKTFRSLARICGAAPSAEGPLVKRALPRDVLAEELPKL
ncbi:MAG: Ppx/GppA family phosphatase, partial [Actinomycetes bacterium]